ncbi:hypothetical protein Q3G72_022997 [Acer saccharum]|nr:hypothetical protein Q3G72_022997 [Acer saccharum]
MAFTLADNNPCDASAPNYKPETPTLEDIILQGMDQGALRLRVALPAKVLAVTAEQTVDVQPLFQTRFLGKLPQDMANLRAVPVVMPRGADYRISMPVAVGDTGLCVFLDRNMDTFMASNGTQPVDPQDNRAHDLSDAVFFPGLVPDAKQTTDTGSDMVLGNGDVTLRLQKSGHISVRNSQNELVDLLLQSLQLQIDTLTALMQAQSLTAFGPAPLLTTTIQALLQLKQTAQSLKQNLSTFQGTS